MPWQKFTSIGLPSGSPATSRPPLMQSSMAYSSATRIGGFEVGSVAPICTIATFEPLVSFASTLPMMFGLGMKPYAFWWCSFVQTPSKPHCGRIVQLVDRPIVVLTHARRVGEFPPRRRDPHGLVAGFEIGRQLTMRHEVEHTDLHACPPFNKTYARYAGATKARRDPL